MSALDRLIEKAAPAGMTDILAASVAATDRLAAATERMAKAQERANEIAAARSVIS